MMYRRAIFFLLLIISFVNGCSRSTKDVQKIENGMPSFIQRNNTEGCDCSFFVERFARAELGLDPTIYSNWRTPAELLAILKADSEKTEGEVIVRKVPESLDELATRPEPGPSDAALLVHPLGHVYLLLGTVMIGDILTYQIVHGDSPVWLIDRKSLDRAGFIEIWQFKRANDGIPIAIGGGTLSIDRHYFNFGKVLPSTTLEAAVTFKNIGNQSIIFTKPDVSCRCTVAEELTNLELKPSESKDMNISFQTSAGSSERHSVFVKVFEKSSGISKRIEVLFLASQQQTMMIEPMGMDFGDVVPNETYIRTINFSEVPTDRFSIKRFESSGTLMSGSFETIGENQGLKTYQVEVVFVPDGQNPDRTKDAFIVETTSILRPQVSIPYTFKLLPEISAEPNVVSLGSVKLGTTTQEKIRIVSLKKESIQCEIRKVPDGCMVNIVRQGNPAELSVFLTPTKSGIWQDKIIIAVKTSSREDVLEIECVGYVH